MIVGVLAGAAFLRTAVVRPRTEASALHEVWRIEKNPRIQENPRPRHAARLLELARIDPMWTSAAFYAAEAIGGLLRAHPKDASLRDAIQSAALEYYYDGTYARYAAVRAMRDVVKSTGEVAFVDTLQRLANMGDLWPGLGTSFPRDAAMVLRDMRARHPDHPELHTAEVDEAIRRLDTDDFFDLDTCLKNTPPCK